MTHDTYELLIDTYQIGGDFSYWILPAVAVMRIAKADTTTEFSRTQKVIAWLPFVTYLSAHRLIETKVGAWKLFFYMCSLVVAFIYLEKWWVAQMIADPSNANAKALIQIAGLYLLSPIPIFLFWSRLAQKGGFTHYRFLGYFAGFAWICLIAGLYIIWKGSWQE